jgi:hypothetical protein
LGSHAQLLTFRQCFAKCQSHGANIIPKNNNSSKNAKVSTIGR